ncbi:hypothetical protein HNS38_06425 [Lentimicrobium sp. L6]|uniref:energy transducer TonB n=1 Tax=Lentimicrobium sp. L6 TaxID=2735916 RepID=UPI001556F88D|nr:energy transducer TonB [Lentimicrobium sp. L6]NPD84384.1 hypothetical protein [Lentimicrobium sp. L6]
MKKSIFLFVLAMISHSIFAQFISYPAEIVGGSYNYKMVFEQEIYYPQAAKEAKAEGEIIIFFTVGEDGFGKDFKVVQSVHPELDQAYIEMMKYLTWVPGNKDGAVCASQEKKYQKFKIKKYDKLVKKRGYDQPPFPYTPYSSEMTLRPNSKLEQKTKPFYKNKEVNVYKFISEYIKIPDAAVKQGIKGEVEIAFIVEPSGRLSNFREIKGLGGGCTEEAYRLIQMLKWEPAKANGEYVRSEYQITVNFGNSKY